MAAPGSSASKTRNPTFPWFEVFTPREHTVHSSSHWRTLQGRAPTLTRMAVTSGLGQKPVVCQPVSHSLRPGFDGSEFGARAQIEAVTAMGVKMDFDRAFGLPIQLQLLYHRAD